MFWEFEDMVFIFIRKIEDFQMFFLGVRWHDTALKQARHVAPFKSANTFAHSKIEEK